MVRGSAMRMLVSFSIAFLHSLFALFRSREEQAIVELALRQQLWANISLKCARDR